MNNKGNALILVTIVCMSVFIMALIALNLSNNEVIASDSYRRSANLYQLALTGTDNSVDLLNKLVQLNYDKIYRDTAKAVTDMDIKDISMYYAQELSEPYSGSYHLKTKDTTNKIGEPDLLFGTTFAEKTSSYVLSTLEKYTDKMLLQPIYKYNYTLTKAGLHTDTDDTYYINPQITGISKLKYSIKSGAVKENAIKTVTKETVMVYEPAEEIIGEFYEWRSKPLQYSEGIYLNKDVLITGGSLSASAHISDEEIAIDTDIITGSIEWDENNPVYYIHDEAGVVNVDVSAFYRGTEPLSTIIIDARPGESIKLMSSDETKNRFKGIIISKGIIILEDTDIEILGMLLSCGYAHEAYGDYSLVLNNAALSVEYDEQAVFNAAFTDKPLYRKLLDVLLITNYKDIVKQKNYWEDIELITGHAKLAPEYSLHIELNDKIKFK